jgi:acetyltransferase-like isoleucine patch superfamily enzyme
MIQFLLLLYLVLIAGISIGAAVLPFMLLHGLFVRLLGLVVAPEIFVLAYVLTAGILAHFTVHSIVAGKFRRDLAHPVYGPRRLYAICWTAIYYCSPVYHAVLAVPALKRLAFRLFGYRGSTAFTTYPDTWLRDLPLLDVGEGAYLSNRATISPNMCLRDGTTVVAPVKIGAGALIGHGTLVSPGVTIGTNSEIGGGGAVGFGVKVGDRTLIGHIVQLDHGATIGSYCDIGSRVCIGRNTVVYDGISVPPYTVIPAGQVLRTQADVDMLLGGIASTQQQASRSLVKAADFKQVSGTRKAFVAAPSSIPVPLASSGTRQLGAAFE